MQRIDRINEAQASNETAELLASVKRQMGGVPNILGTLARSSAALRGYLGLAGGLAGGRLSNALREQIALAVAGANACDYCASAHTVLGSQAGLDEDELELNLQGQASDPDTAEVLRFVARIVATRGNVTDEDLDRVRLAGFSDEEIVEIVANTALNVFTNYFNHVAGTEIDFPVVRAERAAA